METSLNHRFWKHNQKVNKLVNPYILRLKSYIAYKVLDIHRTFEKFYFDINLNKYKTVLRMALIRSGSLNTCKAWEVAIAHYTVLKSKLYKLYKVASILLTRCRTFKVCQVLCKGFIKFTKISHKSLAKLCKVW